MRSGTGSSCCSSPIATFTAEPDAILARYGFGRAHHRVIHFVGRHPQMTVSELLGILRITKQSLSRVLGELVGQGFIRQRPGPHDRRQRLLELTAEGRALEREVSAPQRARVAKHIARPARRRSRVSARCCWGSSPTPTTGAVSRPRRPGSVDRRPGV